MVDSDALYGTRNSDGKSEALQEPTNEAAEKVEVGSKPLRDNRCRQKSTIESGNPAIKGERECNLQKTIVNKMNYQVLKR